MSKRTAPPAVKTPPETRKRVWLIPALLGGLAVGVFAGMHFGKTKSDGKQEGKAPGPVPEGMVWIPGGTFMMGTDDDVKEASGMSYFSDAKPAHKVTVNGFYMDAHEVTNDEFAKFVEATGYVTVAEKPVDKAQLMKQLPPGVEPPPELLAPGSLVFTPTAGPVPLNNSTQWWAVVPGANWKHPEGPKSDIKDKGNHPVVQIAYDDAVAYSKWAGKRLPTEAEWEYAARNGQDNTKYPWGSEEPDAGGKYRCNFWQGHFPNENSKADGYDRTSPAGTYPANRFGLYDMSGNVWEWCSDWYRHDYYRISPAKNPQGPEDSVDPMDGNPKRVQRGGSFLCSEGFCSRYKPFGRGKGSPFEATNHGGFRCVKDAQ